MLRNVILGVADRRLVRKLATSGVGRAVALRFVAGEELDDAVDVVRSLNATGMDVSLDNLGENVTDLDQAKAARETYLRTLERIANLDLRANVSVKLTQMGLDVDPDAARDNLEQIVSRAAAGGTSVTLDMEDHRYTDRTVDGCLALATAHPTAIGIAIQAYLHRSGEDLARLTDAGVHVRLCKGAYKESRAIALRSRSDVASAYASLAIRLLESPSYAMFASHDERLIRHAARNAEALGRGRDTFEFQMLYGVRRELQQRLIDEGYRLRIYVPFGTQWYPYLTRRIAERPANVRMFLEALLRR